MPILAGWLTGEQVPQEAIEEVLTTMGQVLAVHGGQATRLVQPGAGLVIFSDAMYAMQTNEDGLALDWVPERRTLVYRRPLSGIHTLYFIENWPAEGNLLFASEIKALLAVGVPRRLHVAAVDALLRYGFIPAPWTMFRDISVVPAGSILRWQRAKTVVNSSTDHSFEPAITEKEALDQLYETLTMAAYGILPPHDELVALTGGTTPSMLTIMLAKKFRATPFTIATLDSGSDDLQKRPLTEQLADTLQYPLLSIASLDQPDFWVATLESLEAPTTDTRPLALHQLLHAAALETRARVALNGLGASLLFSTYQMGEQGNLQEYQEMLGLPTKATTTSLWSEDVTATLQQEEAWEDTITARKLVRRASQLPEPAQRLYYLDLHLRLPDYLVSPAQSLAQQERITLRSPYLQSPFMKALVRLPLTDSATRNGLLTILLHAHLLSVPSQGPVLPLTLPATSLLTQRDNALVQATLSPEAIRTTGIFNADTVVELLQQETVSRELLLVFTTQVLYQLFKMQL